MMKNLMLGVALIGCALACKTETTTAVADPTTPNAPNAECCAEKKGEGSAASKAECSAEKKAECQKVCPMSKPQG